MSIAKERMMLPLIDVEEIFPEEIEMIAPAPWAADALYPGGGVVSAVGFFADDDAAAAVA